MGTRGRFSRRAAAVGCLGALLAVAVLAVWPGPRPAAFGPRLQLVQAALSVPAERDWFPIDLRDVTDDALSDFGAGVSHIPRALSRPAGDTGRSLGLAPGFGETSLLWTAVPVLAIAVVAARRRGPRPHRAGAEQHGRRAPPARVRA